MKKHLAFIGVALPLSSLAFFDDFNGNSLEPWWVPFSESATLSYNVSGGMLNITGVNHVNSGYGTFFLEAALPSSADFDMSARVGWEFGPTQGLGIAVVHRSGTPLLDEIIGEVAYYHDLPLGTGVFGRVHDTFSSIAEPPDGFHVLRVLRTGQQVEAFFDAIPLIAGQTSTEATGVRMAIYGLTPPSTVALHVDWIDVNVVPEQTTVWALAVLVLLLLARVKNSVRARIL
jgi:hypothetical protein